MLKPNVLKVTVTPKENDGTRDLDANFRNCFRWLQKSFSWAETSGWLRSPSLGKAALAFWVLEGAYQWKATGPTIAMTGAIAVSLKVPEVTYQPYKCSWQEYSSGAVAEILYFSKERMPGWQQIHCKKFKKTIISPLQNSMQHCSLADREGHLSPASQME